MITIRKTSDRGRTQTNWLDSFHTFSFADYYDLKFMGFSNMRVINEDFIQAGQGFGTHPHRNMEIITYVVTGALEHKDSMGTGSIIKPGEIQRMSAGKGVTHSEHNFSKDESLHLLQIWIIPNQSGLEPSYEQKTITKQNNRLILIGSRDPHEQAVTIHQYVDLYAGYFNANASVTHQFANHHKGWLQLISGKVTINGQALSAGDGAGIVDEKKIKVLCQQDAEFLLFDLG